MLVPPPVRFWCAVAALLAAPAARASDAPPPGFEALFNGKDFAGWHGMPHLDPRQLGAMGGGERAAKQAEWGADLRGHWKVEGGEIVNDGQGPFLTTDRDYRDIELRIDFKIPPKGDSGIYLKATPQVQIWDFNESAGYWNLGAAKGSGGLWNNSPGAPGKDPLVKADRPVGEWNRFRIVQVGARTTVYLNDVLVVDHATMENYWDRATPLFARGPIQLQTHGGETRWRNVFLKELTPDEANRELASYARAGFQPAFDGKSLQGWSGATEGYSAADGVLKSKAGAQGPIYRDGELTDFIARLEFRLPPGGNSGLALRYPGRGNPHLDGLCEIQILDDTAAQYEKLDPRQYCGSIYGMIPAHRGFLRPVGAWNFEEVTVRGRRVTVELNGTVVADGDLGKVTAFMGDKPYPGRERASGFFGIATHEDPVEFRNLAIKPLP